MKNASEDKLMATLPESLRKQFSELEHALWLKESAIAASGAICALAASYLLLFFSDRFWDTPSWLRVLLALGGAGLLGAFALRWYKLWVWRRRDLQAFAVLVQKYHRRLGDRLLGIVELADESKRPPDISPSLCRAAIKQVADEAGQVDFSAAADLRQSRRWLAALGASVAVVVGGALIAPQAFLNAFQRWTAPTATVNRFTFVQLEKLPTELIVPHGESFDVVAAVQYKSMWRPVSGTAQFEDQPPVSAQAQGGQIKFTVPGQTQRGRLALRIGDARQFVNVVPTYRPAMKQMTASVDLPDYLRYPRLEESIRTGSLNVLEGSHITFHAQTSRSLASARLRFDSGHEESLSISGDKFESGSLNLEGVNNVAFLWRDNLNLTNAAPWLVSIQAQKDQPPKVELPDLAMDLSILEDEVLKIHTVAQDDYGVHEMGIFWQLAGVNTNASSGPELRAKTETSQEKKFDKVFRFSPTILHIPPDSTVELQAVATDFYPGRKPSESPLYRLHIVGFVKHAEMVRQQLESLFSRLEEVTRREESIANKTRDLKNLPDNKLNSGETAKQIEEQAEEQEKNARNLAETAKEGMKTLREALRNPTFTEQNLREWSKNLQNMQEIAKNEMQNANKSLKSAQESKESERQQQLSQAQMSEEEALRDLEQLQKNVNQGLDNLQAQTLAQRLRKLSEDEGKVAEQLQTMAPETIGLTPRELPPRFQKANGMLSDDQANARDRARTIQDEMSRFYDRTQRPNYGEVSKSMKESNTPDEMEKVRGLIHENIAMMATQNLNTWAKRFTEWADKLEPKSDSSSSDGQSGQGQPGGENKALKELMALLRTREQQLNLQDRTRLLEGRRAQDEHYSDTAKQLAQSQYRLRMQVGEVQDGNEIPLLTAPLEESFVNMHQTEGLLQKPETGAATDQAHVKSVDSLSDAINILIEQSKKNQQQKRKGAQSSTSEEMEFMMQMVQQQGAKQGMMPGNNPGMNMNGGTTDKAGQPITGNVQGAEDVSRTTTKTSGTTRSVPVEFREALDNYFKSLERDNE